MERQGRSRELAKCLEKESLEERQQSLEDNNPHCCSKAFGSALFSAGFLPCPAPLASQHCDTSHADTSVNRRVVYGEALLPCDIPFMLAHTGSKECSRKHRRADEETQQLTGSSRQTLTEQRGWLISQHFVLPSTAGASLHGEEVHGNLQKMNAPSMSQPQPQCLRCSNFRDQAGTTRSRDIPGTDTKILPWLEPES